jgi:hypothetical protein
MKRIVTYLLTVIIPVISLSGQNLNPENLEKLNNYKIGFFTKKLNFTTSEAEKFWPVYNEYQDQRNTIQLEKIRLIRNFNQNESSMTSDQLTETGDKLAGFIVRESDLAIAFHKKLKEILPPAKVIRYYQAENQYKAQLLTELQNARQQKARQGRNF